MVQTLAGQKRLNATEMHALEATRIVELGGRLASLLGCIAQCLLGVATFLSTTVSAGQVTDGLVTWIFRVSLQLIQESSVLVKELDDNISGVYCLRLIRGQVGEWN